MADPWGVLPEKARVPLKSTVLVQYSGLNTFPYRLFCGLAGAFTRQKEFLLPYSNRPAAGYAPEYARRALLSSGKQ